MSDKAGNIPNYEDENCTMCRFYSVTGHRCYRYPPDPNGENDRPFVGEIDWCGEFTPVQTGQESICTCPGKLVARERGPVTFFVCEDCGGRK